ncbi:hypothetical protein BJ875DRAFT_446328 [Amylocarpus encephaloides]|uniref:Uncharacterized protein n=1 Tax=Amylocarpus encephaloides TaxID=45428 RepID=A0A9P7Y9P7_9HELO|nr:hypothetical protein BJ875DRAFT_446328 [Amylocarpus encephaloides]
MMSAKVRHPAPSEQAKSKGVFRRFIDMIKRFHPSQRPECGHTLRPEVVKSEQSAKDNSKDFKGSRPKQSKVKAGFTFSKRKSSTELTRNILSQHEGTKASPVVPKSPECITKHMTDLEEFTLSDISFDTAIKRDHQALLCAPEKKEHVVDGLAPLCYTPTNIEHNTDVPAPLFTCAPKGVQQAVDAEAPLAEITTLFEHRADVPAPLFTSAPKGVQQAVDAEAPLAKITTLFENEADVPAPLFTCAPKGVQQALDAETPLAEITTLFEQEADLPAPLFTSAPKGVQQAVDTETPLAEITTLFEHEADVPAPLFFNTPKKTQQVIEFKSPLTEIASQTSIPLPERIQNLTSSSEDSTEIPAPPHILKAITASSEPLAVKLQRIMDLSSPPTNPPTTPPTTPTNKRMTPIKEETEPDSFIRANHRKRLLRLQERRQFRESDDYLGVQGANPRTGTWDQSPSTSSEFGSRVQQRYLTGIEKLRWQQSEQGWVQGNPQPTGPTGPTGPCDDMFYAPHMLEEHEDDKDTLCSPIDFDRTIRQRDFAARPCPCHLHTHIHYHCKHTHNIPS